MKVAKWGNSLAVRLPAPVVAALGLKEGDEIELHVAGSNALGVARQPNFDEMITRARSKIDFNKSPKNFKFDREESNAR